ncbi:hypothetical protein Q8W71_02220 [Methylobacterium sp. NEAU 140]|uniref:hypothetical protein n=1 Tax=Methylobacterium sp. NEAU 140 TaxID=3064945 RepID=UPI0027330C33|nr:hypothetical protein [Methylobacterium sp. NEAU 140]MDP4021424.1 hypothetical protein [Methylobacterium sp. NEAU 140]
MPYESHHPPGLRAEVEALLRDTDLRFVDIAARTGVSRHTVATWNARSPWRRPPREARRFLATWPAARRAALARLYAEPGLDPGDLAEAAGVAREAGPDLFAAMGLACPDPDGDAGADEARAALPPPSAGEGGPCASRGRERGGATAQDAARSAPSPDAALPSPPLLRRVPSPAEGGGGPRGGRTRAAHQEALSGKGGRSAPHTEIDPPTLRAHLRAHIARQIAAFDAALRGEGAAVVDSARVLRDLGGLKRLFDELVREDGEEGGDGPEPDLPALRAAIARRLAGGGGAGDAAGLPRDPAAAAAHGAGG